jgi:CYTH domain-containing protein
MTVRHPAIDNQRVEIRRNITPREYESYRSQFDPTRLPVNKLRRCFLFNDHYFQLDLFQSPQSGLVLLEGYLDFDDENFAHSLPPWLECVNVTDDPTYSMYHICRGEMKRRQSLTSEEFPKTN